MNKSEIPWSIHEVIAGKPAIQLKLLLPKPTQQGICWPEGKNWLKMGARQEHLKQENIQAGRQNSARFRIDQGQRRGEWSSIIMDFREKTFFPTKYKELPGIK
jgi:hypothetical protein